MPIEIQEIDVAEAQRRIDAGARLFDVREQGEWDEVHAPQATLVPMSEFVDRWQEIDGGDQPAIIVCHSGGRSSRISSSRGSRPSTSPAACSPGSRRGHRWSATPRANRVTGTDRGRVVLSDRARIELSDRVLGGAS
jgi:hypothetical protein